MDVHLEASMDHLDEMDEKLKERSAITLSGKRFCTAYSGGSQKRPPGNKTT